jgi:hypothetical protein
MKLPLANYYPLCVFSLIFFFSPNWVLSAPKVKESPKGIVEKNNMASWKPIFEKKDENQYTVRNGPGKFEIISPKGVRFTVLESPYFFGAVDRGEYFMNVSGTVYEPSISVSRPFSGTNWSIRGKVKYQFDAGSARQVELRVIFSKNKDSSEYLNLSRHSDLNGQDLSFTFHSDGRTDDQIKIPLKKDQKNMFTRVRPEDDEWEFEASRQENIIHFNLKKATDTEWPKSEAQTLSGPGIEDQEINLVETSVGTGGQPLGTADFEYLEGRGMQLLPPPGENITFQYDGATAMKPLDGRRFSDSAGDISLKNCTIKGDLIFNGTISGNVRLTGVTITGTLGAEKLTTFLKPVILENVHVKSLVFKGVEFKEILALMGRSVVEETMLLRSSNFEEFVVNDSQVLFLDASSSATFTGDVSLTNSVLTNGFTFYGTNFHKDVHLEHSWGLKTISKNQSLEFGPSADFTLANIDGDLYLGSGEPPNDPQAAPGGWDQIGSPQTTTDTWFSFRGGHFKRLSFFNVFIKNGLDFSAARVGQIDFYACRLIELPISMGDFLLDHVFASQDVWQHLKYLGSKEGDDDIARIANFKSQTLKASQANDRLNSWLLNAYLETSTYGLQPLKWIIVGLTTYIIFTGILFVTWLLHGRHLILQLIDPERPFGLQLSALPTISKDSKAPKTKPIVYPGKKFPPSLYVLVLIMGICATAFWKFGFDLYRIRTDCPGWVKTIVWLNWSLGLIWYLYTVLLIGLKMPFGF